MHSHLQQPNGPNLRRRVFITHPPTIAPKKTERDYRWLLSSSSKDKCCTRGHSPIPAACGGIKCCKNLTCKSLISILKTVHSESYQSYHLCHTHHCSQKNEAHGQNRTWQRLSSHLLRCQRRCCQRQKALVQRPLVV